MPSASVKEIVGVIIRAEINTADASGIPMNHAGEVTLRGAAGQGETRLRVDFGSNLRAGLERVSSAEREDLEKQIRADLVEAVRSAFPDWLIDEREVGASQ